MPWQRNCGFQSFHSYLYALQNHVPKKRSLSNEQNFIFLIIIQANLRFLPILKIHDKLNRKIQGQLKFTIETVR